MTPRPYLSVSCDSPMYIASSKAKGYLSFIVFQTSLIAGNVGSKLITLSYNAYDSYISGSFCCLEDSKGMMIFSIGRSIFLDGILIISLKYVEHMLSLSESLS